MWPFKRKPKQSVAIGIEGPPPDSIPVIPADETTDPFTYALMKAMEGGTGYTYQGDDGVWRDEDDQPVANLNRES